MNSNSEHVVLSGKKAVRNVELDIIRSIAVYMVLCVHSTIFGGFMMEPISGLGGFAMTGFWVLSSCCVPLFLMLSGFLMNRKKVSVDYYLKYLYIFIPYFVISCISLWGFYLFLLVARRSCLG